MPEFQWNGNGGEPSDLLNGKVSNLNTDVGVLKAFENRWRDSFFSDVRIKGNDPDIRAVWEPARLQHITRMLVGAIGENVDEDNSHKIRQAVGNGILDWLDKNPFLKGPHYLSPMECGLRIPVFAYSLITRPPWSDVDCDRVLGSVFLHGWWVARRLSLFASLGNHTVCECVGLIFAGAVYRKTLEGKKWLERGLELLKQELDHQILDDGGPAEQSMGYHRFVLDLYWLAVDFLGKNHLADCREWMQKLGKGESFLSYLTTREGKPVSIGDSDDGWAVAPGVIPKRWKSESTTNGNSVKTFDQSGYTVMEGDEGVKMTFDHGPLGMAPLCNHGHADSLSVLFQYQGHEFLIDPGTFRYNGAPEFRSYFKGTRAHNTVNIDDQDQAVQETGFIWSHPFKAALKKREERPDCLTLAAYHDGYERLPGCVRHTRTIDFFDGRHFLVKDSFQGEGHHKYELNFHLHPNSKVDGSGGWVKIERDGAVIFMKLFDGGVFDESRGGEDPVHGWFSPCYGVKVTCPVLHCSKNGKPDEVFFMTAICTGTPADDDRIRTLA